MRHLGDLLYADGPSSAILRFTAVCAYWAYVCQLVFHLATL